MLAFVLRVQKNHWLAYYVPAPQANRKTPRVQGQSPRQERHHWQKSTFFLKCEFFMWLADPEGANTSAISVFQPADPEGARLAEHWQVATAAYSEGQ